LFAQHGLPGWPHIAQMLTEVLHAVVGSVHTGCPVPDGQHGWPGPPQPVQRPAWHWPRLVAPNMQFVPAAVQRLWTQQPPPLQVRPLQHGSPGPPQRAHTSPEQKEPLSQRAPVQHGSPGPPQRAHTVPRHTSVSP
jgi:hypothetical protein